MTPADFFKRLYLAPVARSSREWAAVPAWVRLRMFFMSGVDSVDYLRILYHVCLDAIEHGRTEGDFLARARTAIRDAVRRRPGIFGAGYVGEQARMDKWQPAQIRAYERSTTPLDSLARLRLVYRTNAERASGYVNFQHDMQPRALQMYPGWVLYRRPGAKYKRADHVAHDGEIRLKTDFAYWEARNSPRLGGLGLPFAPFGFNSWMWIEPVSRIECMEAGLIERGQEIKLTPAQRMQWGLDGVMPNVPAEFGPVCLP